MMEYKLGIFEPVLTLINFCKPLLFSFLPWFFYKRNFSQEKTHKMELTHYGNIYAPFLQLTAEIWKKEENPPTPAKEERV